MNSKTTHDQDKMQSTETAGLRGSLGISFLQMTRDRNEHPVLAKLGWSCPQAMGLFGAALPAPKYLPGNRAENHPLVLDDTRSPGKVPGGVRSWEFYRKFCCGPEAKLHPGMY